MSKRSAGRISYSRSTSTQICTPSVVISIPKPIFKSSSLLERVIRYAKERQRNERILEQRVEERTEELQAALEELQVLEEELRTQLEETLQSQADREANTKLFLSHWMTGRTFVAE